MDPNGEVHSPVHLVEEIYGHLSPYLKPYTHIDLYEPGIGPGIFQQLYPFRDKTTYNGCDIVYKHPPPIVHGDFFDQSLNMYDVILGNLPFNNGVVHTPCNKQITKKSKTIWNVMLKRCLKHIKPNGYGAFIIPCIWLKPDRENIYKELTSRKILYLKTYSCAESNKLFNYKCQTPICYVIFQNIFDPSIRIWDSHCFIDFPLEPNQCIPTKNVTLLKESMNYVKGCRRLSPIKVANTKVRTETNVETDPFSITSITKTINGFHSKMPGSFHGVSKIILANKLKPIPFKDIEGKYGIYGRDIYIFIGDDMETIYDFLCIPIVQTIIKSFTIRMNFYEKYIFDYLPDPRYCDVDDYIRSMTVVLNNIPVTK